MEIIITDEEDVLKLTDNHLSNDAFVELVVSNNTGAEPVEIMVPLGELLAAVIAFDAKRSKRLSDEQLME